MPSVDKIGRPPEYDEAWHPQAAADLITTTGASLNKVARFLRVTHTSVYRWMHKHEEFKNAVLDAQAFWNAGVLALSLVKRAKGFRFTETTREADDGGTLKVTKKITKYVPPDTGALKFALTNFAPNRFSERKEVKLDTPAMMEMHIHTEPRPEDEHSEEDSPA